MPGDERNLRDELFDAVRNKAPRTNFWKKDQAFDSYFSGAGSQNIWLLRFATKALRGEKVPADAVYNYQFGPPPGSFLVAGNNGPTLASAPAANDRVYEPGFGGSEFMSTIYWVWHLMSHLALIRKGGEIGDKARRWVVLNWVLFRAIQASDGRLMLFGQRSAGHDPIPREPDWLFARASDGDVGQAERWCKKAGAGLKRSWEFAMGNELITEMRSTYKESLSIPVEDLPKLIPLRVRTEIIKTSEGIAVVHAKNCNPNTPPILGGTFWQDGRRDILPTSVLKNGQKAPGGIRIRQKFDHASARIEGNEIVYVSSLYTDGEQRIPLPGGDPIYHLRFDGGTAEPPQEPVPEPVDTDSDPSLPDFEPPFPDLAQAAEIIAGLQLPQKQGQLQSSIVASLQSGDVDDDALDALIAQVKTFGIGPGQPQAVQWKHALEILEQG